MSVPTRHESEVEALDLPGRRLQWLVNNGGIAAAHCSVCRILVAPGDKVSPAHSHPNGEEVIYIMSGSGRVLVAGEVRWNLHAWSMAGRWFAIGFGGVTLGSRITRRQWEHRVYGQVALALGDWGATVCGNGLVTGVRRTRGRVPLERAVAFILAHRSAAESRSSSSVHCFWVRR